MLDYIYSFFNKNKYQYLLASPDNYTFNPNYLSNLERDELIDTLDNFCKENNLYESGVIVSLSGGVDSMVLLAILIYLRSQRYFNIYTATIDYNLREESYEECLFIKEYTLMFNIYSEISHIDNISRKKYDSGSRSEFEEKSREIRFNTYKKIIENYNLKMGVFVAHHKDDIIENIFTNCLRGGNLLDLEIMKPINKINNIMIFRPFLAFHKDKIYNFAHKYGIPYFLDTTPLWSNRGKMRNDIFPLLDSVFGSQWRNKLKDLGEQSNIWGDYINDKIISPWLAEVILGTHGVIIPIKDKNKMIYSHIIMHSLHSIKESMLKRTSLDKIMLLINQTNKYTNLDGNRYALKYDNLLIIINMSKDYSCIKNGNNIYEELINGNLSNINFLNIIDKKFIIKKLK